MNQIKISQLWIYPIKSMKGISLQSSIVESKGLKYDRQWMLVDDDNQFLSQRRYPKMVLFDIKLETEGLLIAFSGMDDLFIPHINESDIDHDFINVTVWNDNCQSIHINKVYDNWFSEALGISCKLVYMPNSTIREVDNNYTVKTETTRFSDGFPFLLLSEASLIDLNHRLKANNSREVSMEHFRPNIVVEGCDAYAEDTWSELYRDNLQFKVVKPCTRCVITTIDLKTGESIGKEPLQTLNTYRRQGNKVIFGQNVLCETLDNKESTIEVGQLLSF